MEGIIFLVLLLVGWVLVDLNRFDRAAFELLGISKGVVALVTLAGNGLGLLLYIAHYRPKLKAAHEVVRSATEALTSELAGG